LEKDKKLCKKIMVKIVDCADGSQEENRYSNILLFGFD
jgi:hypothetical protein